MRKWIGAGLGLLLAAGAGNVVAATHKSASHKHKVVSHKPASPKEPSDEQVRQLMEASGVDRMLGQMNTQMEAMMQQQIPCVPASYWQNFIDAKGVRELTDRMVPIYQRHFSAADIQGLLRFYRSPLGRKVITEMPATRAEGMQLGQEWGRQRAQAMLADLQKSGRIDAQGRCPAAPAAAPGTKLAAPAAGSSSAGH